MNCALSINFCIKEQAYLEYPSMRLYKFAGSGENLRTAQLTRCSLYGYCMRIFSVLMLPAILKNSYLYLPWLTAL
jgi:hypothetical protein